MRFVRKLMIGLAALAAVPLMAQGPAVAPPAKKVAAPAPPAVKTAAAPVALDRADLEAWLDGYLPYALERARIPGAVVVVVKDGQVVLEKGYGFADVAKRAPVLPETTLFRPGSVSKLFTWTAVMQQVEAGKLDLDKDVNAYLDFKIPPYQGKPITLRNIMTHTAGFQESVRYLISSDPKAVMTLKKQMPLALPDRVFAPGTTPAYSNYATALAGYIVERVSGEDFDSYIEKHIFTPLGMAHSSFRQPLPAALVPHMSKGYPNVTQKAEPFEIVIPAPAGSLSASGADMGKFMIAHLNDGAGLLKPETTAMMHNYKAPGVGPLNSMALGFYEQWVNGHRAIAHGGDTVWFHSYLWLVPDADIGVYISMNSPGQAGDAGAVRSALFHKFADRYLPGTEKPGTVDAKTAAAHAQLMVGHYVSSRGSFTNFFSLFGLLGQAQIGLTEDGKISLRRSTVLAPARATGSRSHRSCGATRAQVSVLRRRSRTAASHAGASMRDRRSWCSSPRRPAPMPPGSIRRWSSRSASSCSRHWPGRCARWSGAASRPTSRSKARRAAPTACRGSLPGWCLAHWRAGSG